MIEFRLPALGADMDAGELVAWKVGVGDTVKPGDVVAEVETDKGVIDVEIFDGGEIAELCVDPGTRIPVGTVIARLEGEPRAAAAGPAPPAEATSPGPAPAVTPAAPSPAAAGRVRASPAARRRAGALGIDLAPVEGTGPGGAVELADVERAAAGTRPGTRPEGMRAAIAAAMSRSKREIPHFYVGLTIDLEPLLDWLGERNAARPVTERVLPAACLLAAAARAARAVPELNGRWQGAGPELAERVDLAVIVAGRGGAGGLYAPVIADVAELSLDELMTRFRDIVQRARAGRLRSSELGAGTIAISSLGDRAGDWILPVIQPPQLAIIGFGAIVERPWVVEGAVVPRHVAVATLAADHRAADGRRAAALLEQLAAALAAPATLEVPAAGKR